MKETNYETKEMPLVPEVKKDYKSKDYSKAIHPAGHQFSLKEGQTDKLLKQQGIKNVTDARKRGWTFE